MDYENAFGVYIGRFQPIHQAHISIVEQALSESRELILLIGSDRCTPDVRNPFTLDERVQMIRAALSSEMLKRIHFVGVRDYFYNENMWLTEVQRKVADIIKGEISVAMYGSYKDRSSYYVNSFPQWEFKVANVKSADNSTDVRSRLYEEPTPPDKWSDGIIPWHSGLNKGVADWIRTNFIGTDRFNFLRKEHLYYKGYRKQWEKAPFPPVFVTTDAVVIKSGHVLVIRRGREPGKGLIALPGGFLKSVERIEDCCIRELREETRIDVPPDQLQKAIIGGRVFDYPDRSLRGRTITHAFHMDLGVGRTLPTVKGGDDAGEAFWMPLTEAIQNEGKFFEDHWHLVYYFFMRQRE
jgi:bifunctional NMN adenylyltransferase/nudix hydrolase